MSPATRDSGRLGERLRRLRFGLWTRYGASSVIAGLISEAVFALCYALGTGPTLASIVAFVAGAVPNYLLNRYWAWQRRDRIGGARELVPYLVIILTTAALALLITNGADALVRDHIASPTLRTVLVSAAFLATYGVMFVIKFVLFDRLIFTDRAGARLRPSPSDQPTGRAAARAENSEPRS